MTLFRYFSREVLFTTLVVSAVVLVISVGWRFSGYLEEAAAGLMTREVLFSLMLYRLPGFLELIIPISFFLGIMLVYGRFYVDQEMTVLQSCGMGPGRLMAITLSMALVVMVVTGLITLWLKPIGEQRVEELLTGQKNLTEFDTLVPGRFQSLSSGKRVTYTEDISADGELSGVFINEVESRQWNQPGQSVTVVARSGQTQVDELDRRFLVLRDGMRYVGKPGDKNYQVVSYEEYGQLVERDNSSRAKRRRSALPSDELWGSSDPLAISEFHWRISVVLMIPIIALMAIPLAKVSPRQGRYSRLVPAMILCFLYVLTLSGARSAIERQSLPDGIGLWWVHGIFIAITLVVWQIDSFVNWFSRLLRPAPTG